MRLTKHHGLGNDFLVALDEVNVAPLVLDASQARRLCDRHTGVGADGLIHGRTLDEGLGMTLWNSDGSRAEISGNGLRCLGQAVAMARSAATLDVVIATDAGDRRVVVEPGPSPDTSLVTAAMGHVEVFEGSELEAAEDALRAELEVIRVGRASIGNPHVVAEVSDPRSVDLANVGPRVERAVEGGVNVELIRASAEADVIELAVWERGSGLTQACGSGACVAASFAHRWGLTGPEVRVEMPGGVAEVSLGIQVHLRGPATCIAAIEVGP